MKHRITLSILAVLLLAGCSSWERPEDFRNTVRDLHPYSELIPIPWDRWMVQVNDTLRGEIWLYRANHPAGYPFLHSHPILLRK